MGLTARGKASCEGRRVSGKQPLLLASVVRQPVRRCGRPRLVPRGPVGDGPRESTRGGSGQLCPSCPLPPSCSHLCSDISLNLPASETEVRAVAASGDGGLCTLAVRSGR